MAVVAANALPPTGSALPAFGSTTLALPASAPEGILLELMKFGITDQINRELPPLLKRFGIDDGEDWSGTNLRFPVDLRRDVDLFVTRPGGALPSPEVGAEPVFGGVTAVQHGFSFQFQDDAAWRQGNAKTQLVQLLRYKLQKKKNGMLTDLGRALHLTSDGIRAQVSSITAGGVVTPTNTDNHFVFRDAKYSVWSVSGANWGTYQGDVWVVNVSKTASTFSIAPTRRGTASNLTDLGNTVAATHRLVLRGAGVAGSARAGSSMIGLDDLCDDGTLATSFEGISTDDYPEWEALRIDATGGAGGTAAYTELLLYRLFNGRDTLAGDDDAKTMVIASKGDVIAAKRTMAPTVQSSPGGKATIGFSGLNLALGQNAGDQEVFADAHAPRGRMRIVCPKYVKYARVARFHFRPATRNLEGSPGPGGEFTRNNNQTQYETQGLMAGQLVCYKRVCNAQAVNLETTDFDIYASY